MRLESTQLRALRTRLTTLIPALPADRNVNTINSVTFWQGDINRAVETSDISVTGITAFIIVGDKTSSIKAMPVQQMIKYATIYTILLVVNVTSGIYDPSSAILSPQEILLNAEDDVFNLLEHDEHIYLIPEVSGRFAFNDEVLMLRMEILASDLYT